METLEVRAPKSSFANGSSAKLVKWLVREGEEVDEGTRIATVEKANASKLDVLAPRCGTMVGVGVKIGEELKENVPICSIQFCTHAVIFGGLCTICGRDLSMVHFSQDVPSAQRVNVAYESGLVVSRDEARRTETDKARHLLDRRLLSLVLDLDHTLLHATDDPRAKAALIMDDQSPQTPGTPMLSPAHHRGIHQLVLDGKSFFVKLRPGLGNFLRRMKKKFELHIYTMGTRPYADSIAAIIDPERTLFGERLTSRDDFEEGSLNQKNLRRVFPCDDTMVLIVDDREDVWLEDRSSRMPNLIKARPYHFFKGLHEAYDRTSKAPIETGGGGLAKKKAIPSEEKPVPSKAAGDSTSTKENHNLENSPSDPPAKGVHEYAKSCPEASEAANPSTEEKKTPEALKINREERDIPQSGREGNRSRPSGIKFLAKQIRLVADKRTALRLLVLP
uniref:RNA polymerase II subunit A C-terminal domain phosphatase n=1 Tax=Rhodosorus marinus TaxID=101924 RepID=A0A7S3A5N5_9RHOD|mmetsp:Transcript_45682/g.177878  ORF Transcript_45682/g.177878 Transcript_45682/m.177878 type:complete len:448 (+) Transcript_45682:238-1581(+)